MKEYSPEEVNKKVQEMMGQQKVPNILICGQTGVGKSSVINYIFNDTVAVVGNGVPCTRDITLFKNDTANIYDSEGYEIGSKKQEHYEQLIFDDFLLKRKSAQGDDAVHLVWYAVSGAGKRFTDLDVKLIKRIKNEGYPVGVLLTKIDELDDSQLAEMVTAFRNELSGVEIFKLSIEAKHNAEVARYCDWEKLEEWSNEKLPEVFRSRFVAGLRGGLDLKRKQAGAAIAGATAAAAAVGASPIPFSDAALLIPIQTGMIVGIAGIYGIHVGKAAIVSLTGSTAISSFGKSAAGSLLKLIPGVGTVIGGIINASVAGVITGAIGTALSELCYKQCKDSLDGKPPVLDIETILTAPSFIANVLKIAKENK
jgi:uncharacterized protein (DUF697 family)/GTP-binding protein EngB required for normal cell division